MDVLAELGDKGGVMVKIISYHPSQKDQVMSLYRQGYPDSFDEYDLETIEAAFKKIEMGDPDHGCYLAIRRGRLAGAVQFCKWPGPQDLYLLSYLFVRESMRGRGIGRMLCGTVEEFHTEKARILFTTHAGILPDYDLSYGFLKAIGYEDWGELPGYFRDDLSGIFLVKRNPYYPIGKGIPENSGWCPELADSRTRKRISEEEYRKILHSLPQVPKGEWGILFA